MIVSIRDYLFGLALGAVIGWGFGYEMAPAHADASSYLNYVHSAGINTGGKPDAWVLDNGNRACTLLREGMSVDQIASGISFADKRGLTLAAQHELCPDTVR